MRSEFALDSRASPRRRAHERSCLPERKWELLRGGGVAALSEGWARGGHGALWASCGSSDSVGAVALGGSVDPRAAE